MILVEPCKAQFLGVSIQKVIRHKSWRVFQKLLVHCNQEKYEKKSKIFLNFGQIPLEPEKTEKFPSLNGELPRNAPPPNLKIVPQMTEKKLHIYFLILVKYTSEFQKTKTKNFLSLQRELPPNAPPVTRIKKVVPNMQKKKLYIYINWASKKGKLKSFCQ